MPYVSFDNTAYWERLTLIKLLNKFVDKKEEDLGDNEYVLDDDLEEKIAEDRAGLEWLISASINAYKKCGGDFRIKQSATDTQFIYDGNNPIRLFIEKFVIRTQYEYKISILEIKYYLLQFCIRNNISKNDLGVDTSRELSQEIGYKLNNKFKDLNKNRGQQGYIFYNGLNLNINREYDFEECKEKIKIFENIIF